MPEYKNNKKDLERKKCEICGYNAFVENIKSCHECGKNVCEFCREKVENYPEQYICSDCR